MARWGPFRWVNAVFAVALVAAAAVQANDPDPLPWMAVYAGAAVACASYGRGRWAAGLALVVAVCALAWALAISRDIDRLVGLGELVRARKMTGDAVEQTRELLGLVIVAVWMTLLAVKQRRCGMSEG